MKVASATLTAVILTALALGSLSAAGMRTHISRSKNAGPYHLVFNVGPAEKMGTHGERMVRGKMAKCKMLMMGMTESKMKMKRGFCNHHVELHVYNRSGGSVVTGAHVSIRLHCKSMNMNYFVPIMEMQGGKSGQKDDHYGNNMHLMRGMYDAYLKVNGTSAKFSLLSIH